MRATRWFGAITPRFILQRGMEVLQEFIYFNGFKMLTLTTGKSQREEPRWKQDQRTGPMAFESFRYETSMGLSSFLDRTLTRERFNLFPFEHLPRPALRPIPSREREI